MKSTFKLIFRIINKTITVLSTSLNKINFILRNVKIGKKSIIKGLIFVRNNGVLEIGDSVIFNSSPMANPIGAGNRIYMRVGKVGTLKIGSGSKISNSSLIADNGFIYIGKNVHIGSGCKIFSTDFHSLNAYHRMQVPENPKFVSIGKIKIEDHVYIGASVTILKDVNIGEFSVVGSGSIVTRDIPSREIWGGVPARKIRDLSKDELLNPYGK